MEWTECTARTRALELRRFAQESRLFPESGMDRKSAMMRVEEGRRDPEIRAGTGDRRARGMDIIHLMRRRRRERFSGRWAKGKWRLLKRLADFRKVNVPEKRGGVYSMDHSSRHYERILGDAGIEIGRGTSVGIFRALPLVFVAGGEEIRRCVKSFILFLGVFVRLRKIPAESRGWVLSYYCWLVRFCIAFAIRPPGMVLMASDLSPARLAIAAVARERGVRLVYGQLNPESLPIASVRPYLAIVQNRRSGDLVRERCEHLLYRKVGESGVKIRLIAERPETVGFLLNNFFDLTKTKGEILKIRSITGGTVLIRYHPGTTEFLQFDNEDIVRSTHESLDAFAGECEVVFSGNTSAQIAVLGVGTPVIQVSGLDRHGFDHHGYVKTGVVFGVRKIEAATIYQANEFYASTSFTEAVRDLFEVEEESLVDNESLKRILSEYK